MSGEGDGGARELAVDEACCDGVEMGAAPDGWARSLISGVFERLRDELGEGDR